MSKRSTRVHNQRLEVGLVLVRLANGDVVRLPKNFNEQLCDPENKIFLMVCGYLSKRRDVRKRKYRRIILDPLSQICYKIQFKRKKPSVGAFYVASMKVGKQVRVRQIIIDRALEMGSHGLGKICD